MVALQGGKRSSPYDLFPQEPEEEAKKVKEEKNIYFGLRFILEFFTGKSKDHLFQMALATLTGLATSLRNTHVGWLK